MTTISKRVDNLKKQFGTSGGTQQLLLIVCKAGWGLALDQDTCMRILGEAGFLPTGRLGIVNLIDVPDGLNAEQTKMFLQDHAADICGFQRAQAAPSAVE